LADEEAAGKEDEGPRASWRKCRKGRMRTVESPTSTGTSASSRAVIEHSLATGVFREEGEGE
jgi:hypothetical protein